MRAFILFPFFLVLSTSIPAQSALMPAQTRAAIRVIQKDLHNNRSIPSSPVLDFYPIYKGRDGYEIAVLGKVNAQFNKANAIRDGFDVGAVIGTIVSMRVPLYLLHEGFAYPGIEYIEIAEKIDPQLDRALIDTRANLVHAGVGLPQPYTGKNVLIGIVDWGFDYTHPTFYDTSLSQSRILAAWDQVKIIGTPPPGFSHGAFYAGADQLAAAQSDTFSLIHNYHGTHVAGIAGGSGAGTPYRGIGIESDFLFSQMRIDGSSALDAFQWMYNMAQATGRRLVINNSWGGYRTFPLDGTSLLSQAIDAFSDLGVIFVFSAGNNGDINFHLKKTFQQDSVRTRIMGFNYANDPDLWGQTVTMWGEPGHAFSTKLRILSATNTILGESDLFHTDTSSAFVDSFLIIGPDTVFYNVITDAAHPLNARPQMTLNIKSTNPSLKKILFAAAESGTVHFWNTRLTVHGGGNWGYGFTAPIAGYVNGDKNYGIGHPGVTTSAITVAAHQADFHITGFSSFGPRMDDVLKPEVSGPGQDISSSFNSFAQGSPNPVTQVTFNNRMYKFIRLSGTSMSAPMVAGAVSLLLEANPFLSTAEVKEIIMGSAHIDGFTGPIGPEGSVRWGYGKLDIYHAIQNLTGTSVKGISVLDNYAYPNPAREVVYLTNELKGNETYRLNRLDGALVASGHFNGSVQVGTFSDGMYILSLANSGGVEFFRVVVAK